MHIGRSHHSAVDAVVSIVGGFAASFLALSFSVMMQSERGMRGQLLAGDPLLNKDQPTTYNIAHGIADGSNPMIAAMASYGWWTAVIIGGMIASLIIFKLMRRYV